MNTPENHDAVKTAKNIAAIVYLLVLSFLVGGSYLNQRHASAAAAPPAAVGAP